MNPIVAWWKDRHERARRRSLSTGFKIAAFELAMLSAVVLGGVRLSAILLDVPGDRAAVVGGAARLIGRTIEENVGERIARMERFARDLKARQARGATGDDDSLLRQALLSLERERLDAGAYAIGYFDAAYLDEPEPPGGDPVRQAVAEALRFDMTRVRISPRRASAPHAGESANAGAVLVAATPVPHTSSARARGALVAQVDLAALVGARVASLDPTLAVELQIGGRRVFGTAPADGTRYSPQSTELALAWQVDGGTLAVEVHYVANPWIQPVLRMLGAAAIIAVLLGVVVWHLSGATAARVTRRLDRLADACRQISAGRDVPIPVDETDDEIGVLSRALAEASESRQRMLARLEELVVLKSDQLVRADELLLAAIDAIDDPFAVFDPEDRLIYFNASYSEFLAKEGVTASVGAQYEVLVRRFVERAFGALDPAAREAVLAERLAAHRAEGVTVRHHPDGRWHRVVVSRTKTGFTVIQRAELTDLIRARESAEAASQAKSRFLATMSHELRTPMNGVLGTAQLLIGARDMAADDRDEHLRTILDSGQILLALLDDALDFSRLEAGRLPIVNAAIAPADVLQSVVRLFSATASAKGVALDAVWHGPNRRHYESDPVRLRQMLSNLIGNALKFTASGTVRVDVRELGRDQDGATLEFAVADTGIGVPEDRRHLLFQPFSQVDGGSTRIHGGTGLGLSIVRGLASAMGGEAGYEPVIGGGSRFWFTVRCRSLAADAVEGAVKASISASPAVSAAASPARGGGVMRASVPEPGAPATAPGAPAAAPGAPEAAPGAPEPAPGAPDKLAGRVLVVEDNPVNRKVIMALLARRGLQAEIAVNGAEGVRRVIDGEPLDLVLMDLQMPVLDGCGAAREIRGWELAHGRPRTPVVALTANAYPESRAACLAAGMDDFLAKPLTVAKLDAVLERWLPEAAASDAEPLAAASVRVN